MSKKILRNGYRSLLAGEKSPWKQFTSLDEFIWDGVYSIRLVHDDGSLALPFQFQENDIANLLVKDQITESNLQNGRIIVQTLTQVDRLTGHVYTYTRTRRYNDGKHIWGEWVANGTNGNSDGGSSVVIDGSINLQSVNPVQNKAIAQALEDAVARGRELAKRDLYIAAGALYNDTDEIIKRTAFWGEVVDHLPGHYYLNGLGDIDEEEMMKIYQHKDDMTTFLAAKNQSRFFQDKAFIGYRTLFGFNGGARFIDGLTISAANPFASTNDLEVIKWVDNNDWAVWASGTTINTNGLFFDIKKIRVIDAYTPTAAANFYNAYALEYIRLYKLKYDVNFSYSKNISKESVLHMIQNATPTSAITITLHADAYSRLADDADIVAALEAQPLVSLVSA